MSALTDLVDKLRTLRARLPDLGPRGRKIARISGFVFGSLVVFVLALQLTFPYDRLEDRVIEALSEKFDVSIHDVERGWMPGRVYFNKVQLTFRPSKPDEKTTTIFIDRLQLDVRFLPLLGGKLAAELDARFRNAAGSDGRLEGTITIGGWGRGSIDAHIDGHDLPATIIPVRESMGLPLTGKFDIEASVDLPREAGAIDLRHAEGLVELSCPSGCAFGDGKSKMKPILSGPQAKNQALVSDGIDVGKVAVENLLARVELKDGKLAVTKVDIKSNDINVPYFDLALTLDKKVDSKLPVMQQIGEADVSGCVHFHPTDALRKREERTWGALMNSGAELRADGMFHIKFTNKWKMMYKLNNECGPGSHDQTIVGGGGGPPHTPALVVHPDEPPRPTPAPPPGAPPAPPTAPPATPPTMGSAATTPAPTPSPTTPMPATMTRPAGPEGEGAGSAGSAMGGAGSAQQMN